VIVLGIRFLSRTAFGGGGNRYEEDWFRVAAGAAEDGLLFWLLPPSASSYFLGALDSMVDDKWTVEAEFCNKIKAKRRIQFCERKK